MTVRLRLHHRVAEAARGVVESFDIDHVYPECSHDALVMIPWPLLVSSRGTV
jgi:hypothetical protein